jgi:predicted heme/steroid binding protein
MMMFDGKNLANYQFQNSRVYKFPTDSSWGGGTDFLGNTAVIDLLAPTDKQQHDWLSAFSATSNPDDAIPATISCIYPDLPRASRPAARKSAKVKRSRPAGESPAEASARQAPAGRTNSASNVKRVVTPSGQTSRYKKVSFSGDPDDLFRNVPRSR